MMDVSSSIMQPSEGIIHDFPDLVAEFESLSITPQSFDDIENRGKSFVIIDSNEKFLATDQESFRKKLGLSNIDTKLKVISIFGNSGDGKSHTMNNVFFDGDEIFKMSNEQSSCTMGVDCYYQKFFYNHEILCIDTEGLHGVTQNENQQHRQLLKVLAISDIIIYRTRAERLSIEMYKFLATASKTYMKHFKSMLHADSSTSTAKGPHVIIFHETHNTRPLTNNLNEDQPERVIKEKFAELSLSIEAFSSLHYVGIRTKHPPTDYNPLKSILRKTIEAAEEEKVRPLRTFRNIYEALVLLNDKFSGDIEKTDYTFHELHFTCEMVCEACNQRCENTKDHKKDGIEHKNDSACIYQQQLNNKIYLCKKCHLNGNIRRIVRINDSNGDSAWMGIAKYAWSLGGTQIQKLDCQHCGEIFRAKWYGNKSPEEICVLAEAVHVWQDGSSRNQAETHSAQAIIDGFSYISETISNVSSQPSKSISSWVADNFVNPSYWRANSEIICCKSCRINFERNGLKIHHCRNCGEGFCSNCSRSRMAVPKRGWGTELVRVCNTCRDDLIKNENGNSDNQDNPEDEAKAVRVRKYGELVVNAVSSVASALEIPKEMIKDSVRPDYWAKDSECHSCVLCKVVFGNNDDMNQSELLYRETLSVGSGSSSQESPVHGVLDKRRHHCRGCGQAVCNKCSLNRKKVLEHGWKTNVRVCDTCWKKKDEDA